MMLYYIGYIYIYLYLFSMASMFLRSSRSCQVLSSSLSENRRWCPVTHSAPDRGAREATLSTTSSTLAVLICSENSISVHHKHVWRRQVSPKYHKTPLRPNAFRCYSRFRDVMVESVPFERLLNRKNRVATANDSKVRTLCFYSWFSWILYISPPPTVLANTRTCAEIDETSQRDNESAIQFVLKSRICKNESTRIARDY